MKTIYLTLAVLLTSILSVQAQDGDQKSSIGIKGGYNLSSVSFDGDAETDHLNGFHIGLYGESFINDYFSIQPELLYSKQGYKIEDNGFTYKQELDYINLPIMFKVYPVKSIFFEAGPQIGLSIANKETFDAGFVFYDTTKEFEPENFDWGINLGAGFKTDSGISLGVRHHIGQSDIYDEDKPKNRVWQLYLGVAF